MSLDVQKDKVFLNKVTHSVRTTQVININAGPAVNVSCVPPAKAKTAGIIIIPDRKATELSKISICLIDSSK